MTTPTKCPICSKEFAALERYPNQVCESCQNKASDAYGRRLQFSKVSLPGGFKAFYRDNGAEYHHQICYIDGRKCFMGEHCFGGIVVETVKG
jgi:hypothetical protein